MANERSLLIKLLGDASNLKTALSDADGAVGKHDLSLKTLAGTIGSTYAATKVIEFSQASVAAAAADEASQVTLATQLRNTTQASDDQIASVEAWITKTMFATNTADDVLRPALARLVTSTGSVSEAQDLMGVAIDTAKGKGLSLETAANALARAHDGNTAALGRMGIATKDTEGKTLSFDQIVQNLSATFSGQAAAAAQTQAGKLENMKLRYGELQEQIGTALMPVMEQLVGALSGVATWFSSLDEGTQAWIVRIGLLGGGLVLATRAVNGIIGPLKSLGIIGKTTQQSLDGVEQSTGKMSTAMGVAAGAMGAAAIAFTAWELLGQSAAGSLAELESQAKSLSTVTDEDLNMAFARGAIASALSARNTDDATESVKKMVVANIEGARRLLAYREAQGNTDNMTNVLRQSILQVEADTRKAAETDSKYGTSLSTTTETSKSFAEMLNGGVVGAMWAATQAQATQRAEMDAARIATHTAKDKQFELHTEMYKVEAAAKAQETAWSDLFGKYDEDTSFLNIATNFDQLKTKIADTETAMKNGTTSQEQGMRDVAVEIIKTKTEVSSYIEKLGGVPASKATEINAMIDRGDYDAVEKELAWLTRKRDMGVTVTFTDRGSGSVIIGPKQALDDGGVVGGPRGSPQLVLAHGGETFIPTHKSGYAGIGAGGTTINVSVSTTGLVAMTKQDLAVSIADTMTDLQRRGVIPQSSFN